MTKLEERMNDIIGIPNIASPRPAQFAFLEHFGGLLSLCQFKKTRFNKVNYVVSPTPVPEDEWLEDCKIRLKWVE